VDTVNVVEPVHVLDLKDRSGDTADEALSLNFFLDFTFSNSFFSEGVNNNSEEDVHEDDVKEHEEEEVKEISTKEVTVISK